MSPPEIKGVKDQEQVVQKPAKIVLSWEEYGTVQDTLKAKADSIKELREKYNKVYGSYLYYQFEKCESLIAKAYTELSNGNLSKVKEILDEVDVPDADEIFRYF